jgi:hypothetical protein
MFLPEEGSQPTGQVTEATAAIIHHNGSNVPKARHRYGEIIGRV